MIALSTADRFNTMDQISSFFYLFFSSLSPSPRFIFLGQLTYSHSLCLLFVLDNPIRVAAPPSLPTSDPAEERRIEEEYGREKEEEGSEFKWRDNWYPVSLVEDLDPNLPTRFQLLGRDFILWFDWNDQKWAAFDDLCPHRLAPLSVISLSLSGKVEGRLDENGHLQCSYHGWCFAGCGSCTRIPQAATSGPKARAVKSPRTCAIKFPTMVSQGLLFVWPNENGWDKANSVEPPRLPDDFDKPESSTVTIQRDLFLWI